MTLYYQHVLAIYIFKMNFRFNFISVSDLFPFDTDPDPRVCLIDPTFSILFFSAIKNLTVRTYSVHRIQCLINFPMVRAACL